jgi:fucose permease
MPEQNLNSVRTLKILLHIGFLASGVASVFIGQILPILSARLSLDDRQAGDFFIAQFSGSLVGTFLTNWFGRRNKFVLATIIGCIFMACGIVLLNFDTFAVCFAAFLINGLGIGLTLPSINMLTLEFNRARSASALNILNFFWGVGAICSQPFVDFTAQGTSIFYPTAILAFVLFSIGISIAFMPKDIEQKPVADEKSGDDPVAPIWTHPVAWAMALFNFVHVGFEGAMSGWLKTYTGRIEGAAGADLFPPIFLYFLFFVAGRGIAPVFLRLLSENKMLFFSLLIILLGVSVLLFAEDVKLLSIGAAIAGLGTSSVFPTNVSRFTQIFGASASRRATPLFLCGTLGAAFTTWLIGFVSSSNENDLRSGMFILLGSIMTLILLQSALGFYGKSKKD